MSPKHVGFVDSIKLFFVNYVNFKGRSTRSEYWWFVLFSFLVSFVLSILSFAMGIADERGNSALTVLWTLATLVPGWTITFRRLHDTGRSGLHIFVSLVPVAGPFILLKWLADPSDGDNMWGFCAESIALGRGTSSYNPKPNIYNPNSFYTGGQQNSYNDPNSFYTGGQQNSYNDPNSFYTGEQQNSYNDPNSFYTGEQQNSYNDPNSFYTGGQQNSYNDPNSFYNGSNQQGFGGNSINNNNNNF